MGADVRLLVTLLLALVVQAFARVHTVLLTPSTPSPSWLPNAQAVNFTLGAGRARARVVRSSRAAPCTPLVPGGFARALDAGTPFFLWQPGAAGGAAEVWFYVDGECALDDGDRQRMEGKKLARRKDLDWAQLWGIVLGIAFGLVALAAFACCSWCCCFQHRVRAHQARLHVRDEGVQTANHELPLYERRVRDGEVQLEEAPAPDYHLATRSAAAGVGMQGVGVSVGVGVGDRVGVGVSVGVGVEAERVPLPPSPRAQETATSPAETRHPVAEDARHLPEPTPATQGAGPQAQMPTPQPYVSGSSPPPPPDDLPPAYSHAPP